METRVKRVGTEVRVWYVYAGEYMEFRTGWNVPAGYWCADNEVAPGYKHYDFLQVDLLEIFTHIQWLVANAIAMYGEPTVEHIKMFYMNSYKFVPFTFFEEFQQFLTDKFDMPKDKFSDYIELRDILIEFEMYTRIPVDKELLELGMLAEFNLFIFFVKQLDQHKCESLLALLDDVLSSIAPM